MQFFTLHCLFFCIYVKMIYMAEVLNEDFGLEMTGGDKDLYADLLEAFLSTPSPDKKALFEKAKSAFEKDREEAAKTVHLFKGSSLQIGAEKLGSAAKVLENVLRKKEEGDLDSLLSSFISEYDSAVILIKAALSKFRA